MQWVQAQHWVWRPERCERKRGLCTQVIDKDSSVVLGARSSLSAGNKPPKLLSALSAGAWMLSLPGTWKHKLIARVVVFFFFSSVHSCDSMSTGKVKIQQSG